MANEQAAVAQLAGDAALWCTGEEFLRVTSFNADANTTLAIGVRFLNHDRETPVSYGERHVPNTDRTAAFSDFPLGRGWLQGLTVRAAAGTPLFGHTFVVVELVRGRGASAQPLQTLFTGIVGANTRRAYPGSSIVSSLETPGALRAITGTDPAANTEISETVPTGARWRPVSIVFTLVTDANAANREVVLLFDDGATVYHAASPGSNQAASLTRRYTASVAGVRGIGAAANEIAIAIPTLWMPAGHRIRTATTGIQATDNYGAPILCVEEQLEAA